jgi:DNA-binding GntR family transcriptional regulator
MTSSVQAGLLRTMRGDLVRIIQDQILGKRYAPGERIKEEELSEQLGISRTPIREALVVLEQQGLVVQKPHRGAFVATFEPEEIVDLLRVEAVLEGLAASLAAQHRTEQQLSGLEDLTVSTLTKLKKRYDPEVFYNYDRNFHYKLVECSGSATITKIVEVQFAQIYLCRYYTITAPNRFQHSMAEHQEIVDRLRRSDAAGAEKAARNHLQSVIRDYVASTGKGDGG